MASINLCAPFYPITRLFVRLHGYKKKKNFPSRNIINYFNTSTDYYYVPIHSYYRNGYYGSPVKKKVSCPILSHHFRTVEKTDKFNSFFKCQIVNNLYLLYYSDSELSIFQFSVIIITIF